MNRNLGIKDEPMQATNMPRVKVEEPQEYEGGHKDEEVVYFNSSDEGGERGAYAKNGGQDENPFVAQFKQKVVLLPKNVGHVRKLMMSKQKKI